MPKTLRRIYLVIIAVSLLDNTSNLAAGLLCKPSYLVYGKITLCHVDWYS